MGKIWWVIVGIAGVVAAAFLAVFITVAIGVGTSASKLEDISLGDDTPEASPEESVWVNEDGVMAWRPMSSGEKVAVAIFTLGTALNSESVQGRQMLGADTTSFVGLSRDYGIDKASVWYRGHRLEGADPASFRVAAHGWAVDDAHVWQGSAKVMDNPVPGAKLVDVSGNVYKLGEQGYYRDKALPERPVGEVTPFCHSFYRMNGGLWAEAQRLADWGDGAFEMDCDSSVTRRAGVEDISANKGMLYADGAAVRLARLDGSVTEVARFDAPVAQAEKTGFSSEPLWLFQLDSGAVLLGEIAGSEEMQSLGTHPTLDMKAALEREGELWLGEALYFLRLEKDWAPGAYADAAGEAEVIGGYVLSEGGVYSWGQRVAVPGGRALRVVYQDTLLVGPMCLSYGRYLTDVPMGLDDHGVLEACDVHRAPNFISYDGLRIGFRQDYRRLERNPDGNHEIRLGDVVIENEGDVERVLPERFVQSIRFMVTSEGRPFEAEVERPVPGDKGYVLPARGTLSWPVQVQSPNPSPSLSYRLELQHLPERAEVLGDAPFAFAHAYLDAP